MAPGSFEGDPDCASSREERLGRILAECSDLLNDGRDFDPAEILRQNPDLADELAPALETIRKIGKQSSEEPLGVLGDYRLIRGIGRGGMGVVYEAWQTSMDRRVALKVLPSGLAADSKSFMRFMREARTAGRLDHGNVVPVHAMGVEGNTPYYAMEYVEGETLAQVLRRLRAIRAGEAPDDEEAESGGFLDALEVTVPWCYRVAEAFAGAADGLQHAHGKGIVHRDLKPSNLILDPAGRLRILDFGLAHLEGQESLTGTGDLVGTPLYMSPEQARARKVPIDHRTDIYSLGATLYEVLTGRPPFRGKDHHDTLSQILSRDPEPLRRLEPRIPKDLETIVLKCLRKERADRYGTAEALAQDLRRFVRGDPIEAKPQPTWVKAARGLGRHRWRILAGGCALLFLLATGLLFHRYSVEMRDRAASRYRDLVTEGAMLLQLCEMTVKAGAGETVDLDHQHIFGADDFRSLARDSGLNPLEEAIAKFEAAGELLPDRPDAHYHLGRGFALLGREEKALAEARAAIEADPGFVPARALALTLDPPRRSPPGRYPGGPEAIGPEIGDPESWWGVWAGARTAMEGSDWRKAAELFGRLIPALSSEEPYLGAAVELHLGRGRALIEAGESSSAIECFVAARTLWPRAQVPGLLLGKAYYMKGERENAERTFEALHAEAGAREDEVALWVAALYKNLNDHEGGLRWAGKLKAESLRLRLQVDFNNLLGNRSEAIRIGREAVVKYPGDGRVHHFLAVALLDQQPTRAEGLEIARRASELDPGNADTLCLLASGYRVNRQPEKAEELFLKAIEMDPQEPRGYDHLGKLYLDLGRFEEAEARYRQAARVIKKNRARHYLAPYNSLAGVLLTLGKTDEAIECWEKSMKLDPPTHLPYRSLGTFLRRLGRLDDARPLLHRAAEIQPRDPMVTYQLGLLALAEGNLDVAVDSFRKTVEIGPKYVDAYLGLGLAHEMRGETAKAFDAYLEAFVKAPRDRTAGDRIMTHEWRRDGGEDFTALWDRAVDAFEGPAASGRAAEILNGLAMALAFGGKRKDLDRAYELAAAAVEATRRRVPDCLSTLAAVEARRGNIEKAIHLLEETVASPRALMIHEEQLADLRARIFPRLVSLASIDDVLSRCEPAGDDELRLLIEFQPRGPAESGLASYLEGRVLQRNGEMVEALQRYAEIGDREGNSARLLVRRAECERDGGSPEAAERRLRMALEDGFSTNREVWLEWMMAGFLGSRTAAQLLEDFPEIPEKKEGEGSEQPKGSGDPAADCRWLLERLRAGEAIRIDCGGKEHRDPDGVIWRADCFHHGGLTRVQAACAVAGAEDPTIYQTARWFPANERPGKYRIPLPPGSYRVLLHFAEVTIAERFPRSQDVSLEGDQILLSHDPLRVGYATADRRSFNIPVDDGLLEIEIAGRGADGYLSALEVERAE
jgi:serine/threonine protein kinase/Tfp pilus assembly protein PilF